MKNKNNNPNSKAYKRAATRLVDLPSSDEEKQQSTAGKSALVPKPPRTTSALKKPRLNEDDTMETEPLVSSSSASSSPIEDNSLISLDEPSTAVPTAVDNGTLPISRNGTPPVVSPQELHQSLVP